MSEKIPSYLRFGEAADKSFEQAKAGMEKRKDKQKRFWMKVGKSVKLIFVDDAAAECMEHVITPNGDFTMEWYDTCIGVANGCPHCKAKHPLRQVWMYTVIDTTKYQRQDGTEIVNAKKLLCVPRRIQETLKAKKKEYGKLAGYCFTVTRPDDKSPRCGSDFSIVLKDGQLRSVNFDMLKTRGVDVDPYDYVKEFRPSYMGEIGTDDFSDDDVDFTSGQTAGASGADASKGSKEPAKPEEDLPF
jgi:hypothetical protein